MNETNDDERALTEGQLSWRDFLLQATALGAAATLSTGLLGGPALVRIGVF